jgi:hypothetical protein
MMMTMKTAAAAKALTLLLSLLLIQSCVFKYSMSLPHTTTFLLLNLSLFVSCEKVKQSRYRPGVAQRVPGS